MPIADRRKHGAPPFRDSTQTHTAVQSSRCSDFFHQSCTRDDITLPRAPETLRESPFCTARVFPCLHIIYRVRVSCLTARWRGRVVTSERGSAEMLRVRVVVSKREEESRVRVRLLRASRSYSHCCCCLLISSH